MLFLFYSKLYYFLHFLIFTLFFYENVSSLKEKVFTVVLLIFQNALLMQFLPTLLLWMFTALLPNVVYYSDQYVGHWTRYGINLSEGQNITIVWSKIIVRFSVPQRKNYQGVGITVVTVLLSSSAVMYLQKLVYGHNK